MANWNIRVFIRCTSCDVHLCNYEFIARITHVYISLRFEPRGKVYTDALNSEATRQFSRAMQMLSCIIELTVKSLQRAGTFITYPIFHILKNDNFNDYIC